MEVRGLQRHNATLQAELRQLSRARDEMASEVDSLRQA
jgi:FtsZ-binding cell division protein ZapB